MSARKTVSHNGRTTTATEPEAAGWRPTADGLERLARRRLMAEAAKRNQQEWLAALEATDPGEFPDPDAARANLGRYMAEARAEVARHDAAIESLGQTFTTVAKVLGPSAAARAEEVTLVPPPHVPPPKRILPDGHPTLPNRAQRRAARRAR